MTTIDFKNFDFLIIPDGVHKVLFKSIIEKEDCFVVYFEIKDLNNNSNIKFSKNNFGLFDFQQFLNYFLGEGNVIYDGFSLEDLKEGIKRFDLIAENHIFDVLFKNFKMKYAYCKYDDSGVLTPEDHYYVGKINVKIQGVLNSIVCYDENYSKRVHSFNCVYLIRNKHNGLIYIGQSVNFRKRLMQHYSKDDRYNKKLFEDLQCLDDFEFEIIGANLSKKERNKLEKENIEKYNSAKNGYNQNNGIS